MWDVPLLIDSKQHFLISHMIGPTDLLHPSPAPHFKTFQAYIVYYQCIFTARGVQTYTGKIVRIILLRIIIHSSLFRFLILCRKYKIKIYLEGFSDLEY